MIRTGELIQESYLLERPLGEEECGTLYLATGCRQHARSRFVVLLLRQKLDPFHPRFFATLSDLRKARVLRPLGLLPIEAVMCRDGTPGFVSRVVPGSERLRHYLAQGSLRLGRALSIAISLGQALAAAHRLGVVHGDLRPETILLCADASGGHGGRALLVWHCLHHLRACVNVDSAPWRMMYRPRWQLAGDGQTADRRSDIFALAAILYECLSGTPAFEGPDQEAILERLRHPPAPLAAGPALPAAAATAIGDLLARACAPDPDPGLLDMDALLLALEDLAAQLGVAPEPATSTLTRPLTAGLSLVGWAEPEAAPPPPEDEERVIVCPSLKLEATAEGEAAPPELADEEIDFHERPTLLLSRARPGASGSADVTRKLNY